MKEKIQFHTIGIVIEIPHQSNNPNKCESLEDIDDITHWHDLRAE